MRAPKNVRLNAEREMILLFRTVKNAERVLLSLSLVLRHIFWRPSFAYIFLYKLSNHKPTYDCFVIIVTKIKQKCNVFCPQVNMPWKSL